MCAQILCLIRHVERTKYNLFHKIFIFRVKLVCFELKGLLKTRKELFSHWLMGYGYGV